MTFEATLRQSRDDAPITGLFATVTSGPDRGRSASASDTLTIGTAPSNDLVLSDETVSRFHVALERKGARIRVLDQGSTNGTHLGDVDVEGGTVPPGTTLRLGTTSVRVGDGEQITPEVFAGVELGGLIGRSSSMRQLMARVQRAAQSDVSILLEGETGSGKEVVARAIHASSPRALELFEIVDCGSMQPTLIGSELFGHEKGAFTGADTQHLGAFERARGGTLFLDEIGELPMSLQAALLGALERRSIRRLGGKKLIEVDVRVVCATHRNLRAAVNDGTFRQDLYYRIAVVALRVPSLREHAEDIPMLVEHFARRMGRKEPFEQLFPLQLLASLARHRWPGNVRELRNAVEAALVMGEDPTLGHGPEARAVEGTDDLQLPIGALLPLPLGDARAQLIERFETEYLRALLSETGGRVTLAAKRAQINRSYLSRLLKAHGIRLRKTAEDPDESSDP